MLTEKLLLKRMNSALVLTSLSSRKAHSPTTLCE
jgi:hypothetical protein